MAGPGAEIRGLIDEITREQDKLHAALGGITTVTAPAVAAVDPAAAQAVLERLGVLLGADDTAANALYRDSEALLLQTCGAAAAQLGNEIAAFDYAAASTTLAGIARRGAKRS